MFYDRRGVPVPELAPLATVPVDAAAALTAANREREVETDWATAAPTYRWEDDIPAEIRDRAWEALDG